MIIDITNPVTTDMSGLVTPHGSLVRKRSPRAPAGAHVVKAFNTIFGHVLDKGGHLDAFIAADDQEAKARVSTKSAKSGHFVATSAKCRGAVSRERSYREQVAR